MVFRILGPVRVWTGQRSMSIGAAKQRAVLAMLLLNAGQLVRVDRLVDELWGDRPPARPRVAVHTYVYRLRAWLGQMSADGVRLDTGGDGYLLTVPPDAIDWDRWQRLVADGRAALADGLLEAGTGRLREALAMWLGPALADVDTPAIRAAARGMDEHRAEVLEQCLAAELALGRHAALLPELDTLAAANPYNEGLHGKLMAALSAAGRQADALAVFDRIRRRLADDLGIDPGADLREVHGAILRGSLVPPPRASGSARAVQVPAQLPAEVRAFTGRHRELEALDGLMAADRASTVVITALTGTPGVGKTALAVRWAHRVAGRFPDGQLYVNLRGFDPGGRLTAPAEAVRGFLDTLGVPPERIPSTPDGQVALYRSLLAGKRMLVVLDNARDADQVRPLLPGTPTAMAVVTSRNQLTSLVAVDGAVPLVLDVLSTEECRELLANRLGAARTATEPDAVGQIITACAQLPLALAITAARARQTGFPLASLAAELTGVGRLDTLDAGDQPSQIRAVFSWSYQALDPPAARLFRLLGQHPGPDTAAAAAASLAAHPTSDTRRLLADLTRANLLLEQSPGRYTFHDLLRAYAAEQADRHDSAEQRREATTRLLDHYLHTAYAADRLLYPRRDPIQLSLVPTAPGAYPEHPADQQKAMAWLTAEHQVLLAALHHAHDRGFDRYAWQLAWSLDTYLARRGHRHDQITAWQVAAAAASRLADPIAEADAHRFLGRTHTQLGRYDDAGSHLRHAHDLYARAGDAAGQAHTEMNLSHLAERKGEIDRALQHAQQALTLFETAGHPTGPAFARNLVGWYHSLNGDHVQALAFCEQALRLLQQIGDKNGEAATWHSVGYAHHHLGDHAHAAECYRHGIDIYRRLDDRYGEAVCLSDLGDTHEAAADDQAARIAWQQALDILTSLDHHDAAALRDKLRRPRQHSRRE
ncbi:BTAD domain-containing putative transcriptional regulator [Actinomycetes bacterium KLBMP 9797]